MSKAMTAYGEDEAFSAKMSVYLRLRMHLSIKTNISHFRYRQVAAALEAGVFKANRVRIVPNGLAGVEGGLNELKNKKVSAEKLVYRIADTPDLGKE